MAWCQSTEGPSLIGPFAKDCRKAPVLLARTSPLTSMVIRGPTNATAITTIGRRTQVTVPICPGGCVINHCR